MGQYYKVIILADDKKNNKEVIILYINPRQYGCGSKLMEHSYINTKLLNTVEYLLSKNGNFYKSRIVWAGDYAEYEYEDKDAEEPTNLYYLSEQYSSYQGVVEGDMSDYKYVVNHTKKLYVDKFESNQNDEDNEENKYNKYTNKIHPLPILVSEGNGKGGGDYDGNNSHLCGTWARDVISMEKTIPDGYEKLECNFKEY